MTTSDPVLTAAQQEILAVLDADIDSYLARNKRAWERNWVQDERFQSIMECGTMQIANGFAAFRKNIFDAMDAEPDPVAADVRRENLRIDVRGSIAWATFDEIVTESSNSHVAPSLSHNFRLLENDGEAWRILFHGCWAEPMRDMVSPAIEVSADCKVTWMNAAAVDGLKAFDGLTISNGTLRATSPAWDRQLRATVSRSHELTAFGKFNQADPDRKRAVTFAVVLGEDEEGALLTAWVRVSDARVYVLFGESADLSEQLEVARVIFGFSESQTEIVHLIARGLGLADIAKALSISKNTARTHLRRVFEKAGVGSQIELLRLLVSFQI